MTLLKIKTQFFQLLVYALLFGGLCACAGPRPYMDYVLAHQAKLSAEAAYAPRNSPSNFSQANEYYKQAIRAFRENENYKAKNFFTKAKRYYEKSENYTRVKDFQQGTGEDFP